MSVFEIDADKTRVERVVAKLFAEALKKAMPEWKVKGVRLASQVSQTGGKELAITFFVDQDYLAITKPKKGNL